MKTNLVIGHQDVLIFHEQNSLPLATWAETSLPLSAAGKKLPNVYKSYPKMISQKMKDFDIFTKIA